MIIAFGLNMGSVVESRFRFTEQTLVDPRVRRRIKK